MPSPAQLVVRGGTIVTMDAKRRVLAGDVVVADRRITLVGDATGVNAEVEVDATDRVVVPGLIQGHVHLGQALFRGLAEDRELMPWLRDRVWPLEAAHNHDSAYWSSMLGAADCVLSGTTTIQEIGLVTHMDAVFEAIRDSGLRAIAGKCLMDTGEGVPAPLLQDPAAAIDEARALISTWHGEDGGRILGSLCPRFILSCSTDLWERTVAAAGELGVPVHTHLLEHPREEEEVKAVLGEAQMDYLHRLGVLDTDLRVAHGVQLGPAHREVLAGRPLKVTHCPSANLKLGSGIADLGFLRGAPEIEVGIGTDGAPCNNDMDVLEEVRLAALLQGIRQRPGAFSALEAFELATIGGATALGLQGQIGSLEVGKAADLVVLDLERPGSFGPERVGVYDRIVYGAARDAVELVVVAGRVLLDRNGLRSATQPEVMARAGEEVRALLRRAEL